MEKVVVADGGRIAAMLETTIALRYSVICSISAITLLKDYMKAIFYSKYGSPEVLELKEVEKPAPWDKEVLVKVHATSVNDRDWSFLRGKPFMNRLLSGLLIPKIKILGVDISGRIEAVGKYVKQFQPGDEVFGDLSGCGFSGFAGSKSFKCNENRVFAGYLMQR